jgi:nucleotide-binding universal stress UspA family protein
MEDGPASPMMGAMTSETLPNPAAASRRQGAFQRIAVGINGFPEGEDALALGAALANSTGAELMLVAVHPQVLIVLPNGMDWSSMREVARATLRDARDRMAPRARMVVESDLSIPRALQRVARRDHRDLLVVGSSRHAPEGCVEISKRTRQLLGHFECALAVAPRGLHATGEPTLSRIAVGYDASPEAQAALELAASISVSAGARLHVQGVIDDRPPPIGWSSLGRAFGEYWAEMAGPMMEELRQDAEAATQAVGATADIDIQRGRPADRLLTLSRNVDLLLIGSRRWGPVARLLLGSTGEALLHGSACPVIAVPRPPA